MPEPWTDPELTLRGAALVVLACFVGVIVFVATFAWLVF